MDITNFHKCKYIGLQLQSGLRELVNPTIFQDDLKKIAAFSNENGIQLNGNSVAIYKLASDRKSMSLFVGYPVDEHVVVVGAEFTTLSLTDSEVINVMHKGAHSELTSVHNNIYKEISSKNLKINDFILEEYLLTSPQEPDKSNWETNVFYFIEAKVSVPQKGTPQEQKRTILILEDEEMLSKALDKFLEEYGFEVTVANNGTRAMELIEMSKFDLALLDLLVPGEDGFAVLKFIREKQPETLVYVLSNLEEKENKSKALEIGADKYFVKSKMLLSDVAKHIKHDLLGEEVELTDNESS